MLAIFKCFTVFGPYLRLRPCPSQRDNHRFSVSLPNNFLKNELLMQDLDITYTCMLFRTPSEDLPIVATFHLELSRFRECRCMVTILWCDYCHTVPVWCKDVGSYFTYLRYAISLGTLVWKASQLLCKTPEKVGSFLDVPIELPAFSSTSTKSCF